MLEDDEVFALDRFSQETRGMIRLHQAEDIGHRMPQDFPGVYGEVNNPSIHEFITSTAGLGTTSGGSTDGGATKGSKGGKGKGKNQG